MRQGNAATVPTAVWRLVRWSGFSSALNASHGGCHWRWLDGGGKIECIVAVKGMFEQDMGFPNSPAHVGIERGPQCALLQLQR